MAVIYGPNQNPPQWASESAYSFACRHVVASGEAKCIYCGDPVTFPALYWAGVTGDEVYLHPDCFQLLTVRLMRDLHEIQAMPTKGA